MLHIAVNRTICDIIAQTNLINNNKDFWNKIMLFGDDFRQILPVIKKGNRSAIVISTLKKLRFGKISDLLNSFNRKYASRIAKYQ